MKKRILCLVLCLAMLITSLGVLAACGEEETPAGDGGAHTHSFSEEYKTDKNKHWKECSCGEKKESKAHSFAEGSNACSVCGYECEHPVVEGEYESNATKHWSKVSCGHKVQLNAENHDLDSDNKCKVCGYQAASGHICTFEDEWTYDDLYHWHKSVCCINKISDEGEHVDADSNQACDVCAKPMLPELDLEAKYQQYNWNTTDLIVCLNENSNNQELSSELRRYLAGDIGTNSKDMIDTMVSQRNEKAYATAKVKVTYTYWGEGDTDNENAQWGKTITRMINLVNSDAVGSPDIYVNQIYDMVSAQLQGAFANSRSVKLGNGVNYFSYTDDEFVEHAEITGKEYGYMMEYMSELGFSVKKQYLIASDYFIDLVRAFFVVPLNLSMLNNLDITETTGDRTSEKNDGIPDGLFTAADFYDMVMKGEWTYDVLVQYSQAIWENTSGVTGGSIDDINGFILTPSNGMISSALLYTTSIKMFDRQLQDDGFFTCTYPPTNEDLFAYCDALNSMVSSVGVWVERVSHLTVRDKFTSNQVLFGGIILLGSLEYDSYQAMKSKGGFGILPVPLYRAKNPVTGEREQYLTIIHNMGRIAAIAANTKNFVQCTAFIDYQSTHSSDILNQYYRNKLQYEMSGGSLGNIQILDYIRSNVRSAFDKTYEDAIGWYFKGIDGSTSSWAGLLSDDNFKVTTMRDKYKTNADARSNFLKQIITAYDNLPE